MPRTFKIKNIPGLKGLLVVGEVDDIGFVGVKTFVNDSIIIGDRPLKYPVPDGAVFISIDFLEEVEGEIANMQFATDNPFGDYMYEGRFQKGNLEIVHAVYKAAVSVSIIEKNPPNMKGMDKTIFAGNFFEKKDQAIRLIEDMLHGNLDPDDLIFELRDL